MSPIRIIRVICLARHKAARLSKAAARDCPARLMFHSRYCDNIYIQPNCIFVFRLFLINTIIKTATPWQVLMFVRIESICWNVNNICWRVTRNFLFPLFTAFISTLYIYQLWVAIYDVTIFMTIFVLRLKKLFIWIYLISDFSL